MVQSKSGGTEFESYTLAQNEYFTNDTESD